MRDEHQSFDAWLAAGLRDRFGDPEPLPDGWLALIDAAQDHS